MGKRIVCKRFLVDHADSECVLGAEIFLVF
jgi:hypothetical protein